MVAAIGLALWSPSDLGLDKALITGGIAALMILSVVVVTGYGGQLSLSQWALAGFAAWVSSRLADTTSLGFWGSALVAVIVTIPVAVVVGLPALRSRGVNLAIATVGLALLIESMILGNSNFTGGFEGTRTKPPSFFGLDLNTIVEPAPYAILVLVVVAFSALMVANVRRSRTGLRLLSVRSNERAAAALGINVFSVKLYAFALASVFAALAGVLFAFEERFVLFGKFHVFGSIQYVTYSVIGGVGWVLGAMLSGLAVSESVLPTLLESLVDLGEWLTVILGLIVLLILMVAPEGIAARLSALRARLSKYMPARLSALLQRFRRSSTAPASMPVIERRPHVDLPVRLEDVTVKFGGVVALDHVSMEFRPRVITGLIGPNGAGKTTLLDTVTGFTKPSSGSVFGGEENITSTSPTKRARLGMGRSFQSLELFEEMSVRENLLTAVERHDNKRFLIDPFKPGRLPVSELMLQVIDDFELEPHLEVRPTELPQGIRRIVGIARAILNEPSVLFLDEPAAGLDERETTELGQLLRRIVQEYKIAIVLVEHDVPLVMDICSHIVVLDFGSKIAEGDPETIKRDPKVVAAYLGTDDEEASEVVGEVASDPSAQPATQNGNAK